MSSAFHGFCYLALVLRTCPENTAWYYFAAFGDEIF
jgi:hypothetical protein